MIFSNTEFSRTSGGSLRITTIDDDNSQEDWIVLDSLEERRLNEFLNPHPVLSGKPTLVKENFVRARFSLVGELLGLFGVVLVVVLVAVFLFGRVTLPSGNVWHQGKYFSDKPALQLSYPVKPENGN